MAEFKRLVIPKKYFLISLQSYLTTISKTKIFWNKENVLGIQSNITGSLDINSDKMLLFISGSINESPINIFLNSKFIDSTFGKFNIELKAGITSEENLKVLELFDLVSIDPRIKVTEVKVGIEIFENKKGWLSFLGVPIIGEFLNLDLSCVADNDNYFELKINYISESKNETLTTKFIDNLKQQIIQ